MGLPPLLDYIMSCGFHQPELGYIHRFLIITSVSFPGTKPDYTEKEQQQRKYQCNYDSDNKIMAYQLKYIRIAP
jgi:hypothetical protein